MLGGQARSRRRAPRRPGEASARPSDTAARTSRAIPSGTASLPRSDHRNPPRRQSISEPLQAQSRALRDAHHVPRVRESRGRTCGLGPAGSYAGFSRYANTTPEVPTVQDTAPASTMPFPMALAAWSPPPPTTGVPAFNPVAIAASLIHRSRDLARFVGLRQNARIEPQHLHHLASTTGDAPHRTARCRWHRKPRSQIRRSA